jgi:hypothetical protein
LRKKKKSVVLVRFCWVFDLDPAQEPFRYAMQEQASIIVVGGIFPNSSLMRRKSKNIRCGENKKK